MIRDLGPGRPFGERWIGEGIAVDLPTRSPMLTDIGFTGTQSGMTVRQRWLLEEYLAELIQEQPALTFHHGDCIGADAEAHRIADELGYRFKVHPPERQGKRAFVTCADPSRITWAAPAPFLVRNRQMVREIQLLTAGPKEQTEILRSGTWSTIRYAKQEQLIPVKIFLP